MLRQMAELLFFGAYNIEFRGIGFQSGVTDLYLDYVNIIPGDFKGCFSNEFTVTGKGEVGIGTKDTKGYRLAVNGDAMFTKVKVKSFSNWPDYVLQGDYDLPSLQEVEQYIQKHRHLSDIPSAAEVEKGGVDLGEMNKQLLKKIEEMTLYIIELKKDIRNA